MTAISERPAAAEPSESLLDSRTILRYYLPLAMSWVLMALDGPVNVAIIQRLPRPELGAAAFAILFSLSIWIESPIIDLLATSTTLATSRERYALMRRFVGWLVLWVTGLHALVSATPLYGFVTERLMGLPHELSETVRPALMILIPWSGLIGWRRSLQGIMIRNGLTRAIGIGTVLRGVALVVIAFSLYFWARGLSSVVIASIALLSSVLVEAAFVQVVSRSAVRNLPERVSGPELTMRSLIGFHFPLTATTMIALLMGPLVAAGLARTPEPIRALAAYQVASAAFLTFRMISFCLPEIVITLGKDERSMQALKRFSLSVGAFGTAAMLLMSAAGLDQLMFRTALHAPPEIVHLAHLTFLGCAALPLVDAAQSYVRGVLTAQFRTTSRLVAVGAAIAGLGVVLVLGVVMSWPGFVLVGLAITAALICELTVLVVAVRRPQTGLQGT